MPFYYKEKMDYLNINQMMDRLTRHPLLTDITLETVIDYAVEFIRIVGMPPTFLEKTADIEIDEYRGSLPCDFYQVIQVRGKRHCGHGYPHAFRYSTDSFHMSEHKHEHRHFHHPHGELTYKIQGSVIITSIPKGTIEIAYMAMPIDEDGYPMIPDNSSFIRALELYIKLQWFTMLFDTGKINQQVLQNTQQQYAWAVGQAQTDLIRPTLDQMEALSRMWNKFLPDVTQDHAHGYINQGSAERMRIK